MLRAGLGRPTQAVEEEQAANWRVSSGSAAVLGLCPLAMEVAPTTAYLMLGERCRRSCAFCAQARDSRAPESALSRVLWPAFDAARIADAVAKAYAEGRIARACYQVTVYPDFVEHSRAAVALLAARCNIPICVSIAAGRVEDVEALLAAGAERVTLALDAATPTIYEQVKGGDWERAWLLLQECARRFPGRMGTHLIVGLGESEREMIERIQALNDIQITIGLFALTPVKGTAWAEHNPPLLDAYRRVQAARWLIVQGMARAEAFHYDTSGRLISLGLSADALRDLLRNGEAYRTAGCPGCNRPYYNERPGGTLYNYPRPLTEAEGAAETEALLRTLSG
ncbi:MAG: radical SAM protein [Chloroflexi bacterium]|nr:radical SAM protein [Chloroflexota bacterium]